MKEIKLMRWLMATAATVVFAACTTNPVSQAESVGQKAFALYGTYVIFQGKAAELVQDATVPERVKQVLRAADQRAYPVAESLVDAATTVEDIRTIVEDCKDLDNPELNPSCSPTNQRRLENAVTNLSAIYFQAQPIILDVVAAVKGAK